jgi:hypothetical protein
VIVDPEHGDLSDRLVDWVGCPCQSNWIGKEVQMIASPARYCLGAALVILTLCSLAKGGPALGLWQSVLVILLVAVPVRITLAYLSAVRKANATAILQRPVWWGVFLSGHGVRMAVAIVPAFVTGLGMVAAILVQGVWAVAWIAAAALLVLPTARFAKTRATMDLRPFARVWLMILFAVIVTAIALTVAAMTWFTRPDGPDSVSALFGAASTYRGPSAAVALMADWVAFLAGAQSMAEQAATGQGVPGWIVSLWRGVAVFSYHTGLALAMAAPLLLTAEARRILAPTADDTPARVAVLSVAVASAAAVILAIAMLQVFARVELMAQLVAAADPTAPVLSANPKTAPDMILAPTANDALPVRREPSPLSPAGLLRQIEVELIGDLQCPPGTIDAIEAMDSEFRAILITQQDNLRDAIGVGFDGVRANVPGFLDWYYSLSAEYLRTANLLIGNGVTFLEGQFSSHLEDGAPLAGVDAALGALSANQILADIHRDNRVAQLANCALALPQDEVRLVATAVRPDAFLGSDLHVAAINFETRLAATGLGGIAGLATGAIVAKIGAKAVVTSAFKTAAAAIAKIAGSKALSLVGGILIGGGTGAASGSVVPVVGTTAGAIAGGIVGGAAVMFGVDFALLKLEEEISRADFEVEIIASIDAAEAELLGELGLSMP